MGKSQNKSWWNPLFLSLYFRAIFPFHPLWIFLYWSWKVCPKTSQYESATKILLGRTPYWAPWSSMWHWHQLYAWWSYRRSSSNLIDRVGCFSQSPIRTTFSNQNWDYSAKPRLLVAYYAICCIPLPRAAFDSSRQEWNSPRTAPLLHALPLNQKFLSLYSELSSKLKV